MNNPHLSFDSQWQQTASGKLYAALLQIARRSNIQIHVAGKGTQEERFLFGD